MIAPSRVCPNHHPERRSSRTDSVDSLVACPPAFLPPTSPSPPHAHPSSCHPDAQTRE